MTTIQRVQISDEAVFTRLDEGHAALLHLRTKRYYDLQATGVRIWELLADGCAIDEVVDRLTEEFVVEPEVARSSVEGLVRELEDEGLVRISES